MRAGPFISTILLCTLLSCDTGLYITKSKHLNEGNAIDKIVSIEPVVSLLNKSNKEVGTRKVASFLKEQEFTASIANACKRNGIELLLYDLDEGNVDAAYFNQLCRLKYEINRQLGLQVENTELLENETRNLKTLLGFSAPVHYFDHGVEIQMDYLDLAEHYGTKYFSVQSLFTVKKNVFFINAAVDVVHSEFVYTEVRRVVGTPSRKNLVPVLYDSFAILKTELR